MAQRRTLLSLARRAGVLVGFPCRGVGVCGRCTVEVLEGTESLEPLSRSESALAARAGLGSSERISCLTHALPGGALLIRVGGATHRLAT